MGVYLPRLQFRDAKDRILVEYVPPESTWIGNILRGLHIRLRTTFGKDIYYWHVRHASDPEYRKITDIQFILHVLFDHDNQYPDDPIERRHFKRAWKLYGNEIEYFIDQLRNDTQGALNVDTVGGVHPYARAYGQQWFSADTEPEQKLMYHGLSIGQYAEVHKILTNRAVVKLQPQRNDPE